MQLRSALGCFLAASAILGLVLAPIARPVMAMPMDMHESMGEPTAADAVATTMPDDMPCCPDKTTVPDCGKDCPLMALCGATLLQFVPQVALIVPGTLIGIVFPGDYSALASVARAPPRKPPKI
jgi:hypothetical protein